jgi:hypothetical protein
MDSYFDLVSHQFALKAFGLRCSGTVHALFAAPCAMIENKAK